MSKKAYSLESTTIDIYFQKSLKFLFPLLNISSQEKIKPVQTYLTWKGVVNINECKLVCLYELEEFHAYNRFTESVLLKNELLVNHIDIEDDKEVFIFNLTKYKADFKWFLKGRYSKMSDGVKQIILEHYKMNKFSVEYMDSYLNPDKYFEKYASLLNIQEWRLREIGELCDPFDLEKETLVLKEEEVPENSGQLLLFS